MQACLATSETHRAGQGIRPGDGSRCSVTTCINKMHTGMWTTYIQASGPLTYSRELLVVPDGFGSAAEVLAVQGHQEKSEGHDVKHLRRSKG
jgi:hypothetical protein